MIAGILSLMTLGLCLGTLLGVAARFFKVEGNPLEAEIEAMFPGSQCGQCGFPGCSPAYVHPRLVGGWSPRARPARNSPISCSSTISSSVSVMRSRDCSRAPSKS